MLGRRAYPLHSIANLFTFDLTIRLRDDILTPRGPVDRRLARCAGQWPMRPSPAAAEIWEEVVRRAAARSDRRSKGRRLDEVAIGQRAQGTGQ